MGCRGGNEIRAWNFLRGNNQAQVLARNYPYTSGRGDSGRCIQSKLRGGTVKITGVNWATPHNSVSALKAALNRNVVTAHVDASSSIW